jgi:hypothetical protein
MLFYNCNGVLGEVESSTESNEMMIKEAAVNVSSPLKCLTIIIRFFGPLEFIKLIR